jgi:hypothetical protein
VKKLWPTAWSNPIFQLELGRLRRKGWWPKRGFYVVCLAVYPLLLAGLGACGVVAALVKQQQVQIVAAVAGLLVAIALGVFAWLLGLILPWAAPALTAPSIVRERESGTLDLLRGTLLTERSIVMGKLAACLMQMWPGVFLLIILTPFQVIKLAWGSLCLCPTSDLAFMIAAYDSSPVVIVGSVLLVMLMGTLRPLADMTFNAAVGLVVSVLAHSTGVAVASAYGVVLAIRAFVYLATALVTSLLAFVLIGPMLDDIASGPARELAAMDPWMIGLLVPSAIPVVVMVFELVGAGLLVWVAVRILARH